MEPELLAECDREQLLVIGRILLNSRLYAHWSVQGSMGSWFVRSRPGYKFFQRVFSQHAKTPFFFGFVFFKRRSRLSWPEDIGQSISL